MQQEVVKPTEGNGLKPATERQRQLIEQLLQSSRIEKVYKRYVQRALQSRISSCSASKAIAFLVSLIAFKKDFVRPYHNNGKQRKKRVQKVPVEIVRNFAHKVRSDLNNVIRALEYDAFDAAYNYLSQLDKELSNLEFIEVREM
jgi:hypothetical protein